MTTQNKLDARVSAAYLEAKAEALIKARQAAAKVEAAYEDALAAINSEYDSTVAKLDSIFDSYFKEGEG